ncbi:uncharacterized protein [Pocillopora verrucosa]|uniref:uncharacterized protein n=1 Tax=Pocillopora verrucosa TaxID=203993 RepID=UPI0033405A03
MIHFCVLDSSGDKISGIQVKLEFGDELSSGADKSDDTPSDNGVDFNASLSAAATSEGKDSANQEKVNLEDELLSGQFGFKKESDDDDGKSTDSQQASSKAAVGSLDFADKGLSDESEATPVEKKVDMKDAPLVDQEKSQVLSSGKSKDLDIGSSTVGKEDNMAANENLAAADNSSLVITETQVEAAEGDENFPFNNSSVTKEAQVEAAEGNQDLPGNSSLGATKSEATSSDNGVGFKASLSVADTSGGKDSANQEKVNLEDELSSDQEKSQVLFSGKSKDLEIESSTGTSEDKVKAIQENLALDDKLSSVTSKKKSDGDESKPKGTRDQYSTE